MCESFLPQHRRRVLLGRDHRWQPARQRRQERSADEQQHRQERIDHLRENFGALDVSLSPATVERLDRLINTRTVSGPRYNDATLPEIDTEEV